MLCADALEQLGYAAESSVWRNTYLQGALELREGINPKRQKLIKSSDMTRCMSVELMLKYIGILLDKERAQKENFRFLLQIQEPEQTSTYMVELYSGVLLTYRVPLPMIRAAVSLQMLRRILRSCQGRRFLHCCREGFRVCGSR